VTVAHRGHGRNLSSGSRSIVGISSDIRRVEGIWAGLAQHLQNGLIDLPDTRYETALRWSETGAEEKLAKCSVRSCATLLRRLPCHAQGTPKTTFHETRIQEKSKKNRLSMKRNRSDNGGGSRQGDYHSHSKLCSFEWYHSFYQWPLKHNHHTHHYCRSRVRGQ
jgi:hypothetical protein